MIQVLKNSCFDGAGFMIVGMRIHSCIDGCCIMICNGICGFAKKILTFRCTKKLVEKVYPSVGELNSDDESPVVFCFGSLVQYLMIKLVQLLLLQLILVSV